MKPQNLISTYQGAAALDNSTITVDKRLTILKKHEIRNITSFCNTMLENGCSMGDFDGFFVGYVINQISKEFDLLRFGPSTVLNIELKSELKLSKEQKHAKILDQMRKNYYYLRFLKRSVTIFSYVENDGFYQYNAEADSALPVDSLYVAKFIKAQAVDYGIDPDKEFVPSNYLISPFNSTEAFINGEYFLTSAQQKIENEINEVLTSNPFTFFCISANAGTGKTLLLYDIAKKRIATGANILIIHCGILNEGHEKLRDIYGWNIKPIKEIPYSKENTNLDGIDCVLLDESQRIRSVQLNALIQKAAECQVPIIFSYDPKQYLRTGETLDVADFLQKNYPMIPVSSKKLTNKIRTNKSLASFINNLLSIGKSTDNLNYDNITIEYANDLDGLKIYIEILAKKGWVPITYTTSQYDPDPYDDVHQLCEKTAHSVIGQEFSKVVFVMDQNFAYGTDNKLYARMSYYDAKGMLYQIATRVVDELKIIVLDNPDLYANLLNIKAMGIHN